MSGNWDLHWKVLPDKETNKKFAWLSHYNRRQEKLIVLGQTENQ